MCDLGAGIVFACYYNDDTLHSRLVALLEVEFLAAITFCHAGSVNT